MGASRKVVTTFGILFDAVAEPVEAQVQGFGAALPDVVIGDAAGGPVVSLDGVSCLRETVRMGQTSFPL